MTAARTRETSAAEFVEYFADGWAMGARDPEGFFRHFERRTHPNVSLSQPIARTVQGPAALRQLFAPLFAAMPDLHGEVLRWGATDDGVIIELALSGTLGGRPLEWQVVDRIILEDGRIRERRSYFDSLPLFKSLALRPRASVALLFGLFRHA
jgi:ketosteroid isomerase-like protein